MTFEGAPLRCGQIFRYFNEVLMRGARKREAHAALRPVIEFMRQTERCVAAQIDVAKTVSRRFDRAIDPEGRVGM